MCGIFGWVAASDCPMSDDERAAARRAAATLAHRGPDGDGEWLDGSVYLGHRRLKIIDLSDHARQPFVSPSGRYVVIFNGEIYNYIELRRELESAGCRFKTSSDTEVLAAAYERWGAAAFSRFDGMFAAGIHDRQSGAHVLVRDHLGQKPLYYTLRDGKLVYASELRALLTLDRFTWQLDRRAYARYLANCYFAREETPVAGIRKLLPGHYLELDRGRATIRQYWHSRPGGAPLDIDAEQAAGEFSRLFDDACALALRADVPVGVFLSGGIDSSLVLSYAARHKPNIRAYSLAVADPQFDESQKAARVAALAPNVEHHVLTLAPDTVEDAIAHFADRLDEPHGDPGYLNALLLSRFARQDIVVALSGDGADEIFYGYKAFNALNVNPLFGRLPLPVVRALAGLVQSLPREPDGYMAPTALLRALLRGYMGERSIRPALWLAAEDLALVAALCPSVEAGYFAGSGAADTIFGNEAAVMRDLDAGSSDQRLAYYYQQFFLPEFVCLHTDRAAMRSSLEVRSPFLSPAVVGFANRLPDKLKRRGWHLKALLRDVLREMGAPAEIWRQPKRGFTFPLARWLKGPLRPLLMTLLDRSSIDALETDAATLRRLIDDHLAGRRNHYRILMNMLTFMLWRRENPIAGWA